MTDTRSFYETVGNRASRDTEFLGKLLEGILKELQEIKARLPREKPLHSTVAWQTDKVPDHYVEPCIYCTTDRKLYVWTDLGGYVPLGQ